MRSPLGTGSCQGSAQELWAGGIGEAELEENGIFQGCWHQIQVGRSLPVPKSTLGYGTFTFLGPILLLSGFSQSFLIPMTRMGEMNPALAVPGGLHRHQGAPSPVSHPHQI